MNYHQEHEQQFSFHETQNFTPEYIPEVRTPAFIDKDVISKYSKLSWPRRFFSLPKVSTYVLESLSKSIDFSNDLNQSLNKLEKRVDRLNDKFVMLEGMQVDFKSLMTKQNTLSDKLKKIEANEGEIVTLKQQVQNLTSKNRIIMFFVGLLMMANLGLLYFVFQDKFLS